MSEEKLVVLQVCADHVAADVLANSLRAESVPALVRNLAAIPGLEQGAEVLVPIGLLQRAKWLLAQRRPTDAELTHLAMATPPQAGDDADDQSGD
ncbi:MAG: hypothetical protein ACRD3Q_07365 [Terriglobales bacterium]